MKSLSLETLLDHFPQTRVYRKPRQAQEDIFAFIAKQPLNSALVEASTGIGKTAVEYAIAQAAVAEIGGTAFIVTPNKTIVDQIRKEFPNLKVALGRNEHPCLYYEEDKGHITSARVVHLTQLKENPRADAVPCSLLTDCPHRVDQVTGETHEKGAYRCPYLQAKYEAKQGGVVLATMSFFLFTHLFSNEFDTHTVISDEVHQWPDVVRNALSYEITDYQLTQTIKILRHIGARDEAKKLAKFARRMKALAMSDKRYSTPLLDEREIESLINILETIDQTALKTSVAKAVRMKIIDPKIDRTVLRKLEMIVRDIRHYITTLNYSLTTEKRKALNYTCAFYRREKGDRGKWETKLVVKCYYVVPVLRKILKEGPMRHIGMSATIGRPEIFKMESGLKDPFLSLDAHFPPHNSRLYMPTDTADLSFDKRQERDLPKSLRRIARACAALKKKKLRALVIVVSNRERDRFLSMSQDAEAKKHRETFDAVSYGDGVTPRRAAEVFKAGRGDVLVGTEANYTHGIDLPDGLAPVIFYLRPGYPSPEDPGTQFEEKRYGSNIWKLRTHRAMLKVLQTRGRNIRSWTDSGVTILMSRQFKKVAFAALPEALEPIYVRTKTFDQAVEDAMKLLR